MGVQKKLIVFIFNASLVSMMLPLVSSSQDNSKVIGSHSSSKDNNIEVFKFMFIALFDIDDIFFSVKLTLLLMVVFMKMNPRLLYEITLHGFLLWASMGFLIPVGILVIRMSNGEVNQRRLRIIFYVHAVLQASLFLNLSV